MTVEHLDPETIAEARDDLAIWRRQTLAMLHKLAKAGVLDHWPSQFSRRLNDAETAAFLMECFDEVLLDRAVQAFKPSCYRDAL
jgi:hypothetical protein